MLTTKKSEHRTTEQGRSGVFVFVRVRICSDLFGFVRFVRICSLCSVCSLCSRPRSFGCSVESVSFFVGSPSATLHCSASAIQTSLIALGLIAALTRLWRLDPATPRKYQSRRSVLFGYVRLCSRPCSFVRVRFCSPCSVLFAPRSFVRLFGGVRKFFC